MNPTPARSRLFHPRRRQHAQAVPGVRRLFTRISSNFIRPAASILIPSGSQGRTMPRRRDDHQGAVMPRHRCRSPGGLRKGRDPGARRGVTTPLTDICRFAKDRNGTRVSQGKHRFVGKTALLQGHISTTKSRERLAQGPRTCLFQSPPDPPAYLADSAPAPALCLQTLKDGTPRSPCLQRVP